MRRAAAVAAAAAAAAATPNAAPVLRRWTSSAAGQRIERGDDVPFAPQPPAPSASGVTVTVDDSRRFQTMRGFGASFLESGAINLNNLPAARQTELLDLLFAESGAGLSAMKATIPSNDFAAAGPWYTFDDSPGDVELRNFSIARDLRPNGTLSFIKRAKEHGFSGVIQSYMDYPPDWMLKGDLPDHATVDPKYYSVLANYFAKFVQSYAEHGVTIDYLSLFNEPIDSYTNITDAEMAELLGGHVGPLFDKLGLRPRTKLTYGGQATRLWASMHVPVIMRDARARRYMDHIAYHGYDCQFNCTSERQEYDKVASLHRRWPELEMWMTEICYAYNGDDPNCASASTMGNCTDYPRNHSLAPPLPRFEFDDGRVWGSRIIADIKAGVSGWIYWNMLLDEAGGPFQYSPAHGDDDENLQQALVHVDSTKGTYRTTGLFWYLAHFSKFVRPGSSYVAADVTGTHVSALEGASGVEAAAFSTPDGGVVLQLLNHNGRDEAVTVRHRGHAASVVLPAVSITTAQWGA